MPDIDEHDRSTPVSETETIGGRAWLSLLAGIALLAVAIMMIPGGRENPTDRGEPGAHYNAVHAGTNPASVKPTTRWLPLRKACGTNGVA
jgi:hypothetical protein